MTEASPVESYLRALQDRRDAGERAHAPALRALLQELLPELTLSSQPGGDEELFALSLEGEPAGHLALAAPGIDLDQAESRDMKAFDHLLITNYLAFRWYSAGDLRSVVHLGHTAPDGRMHATRGADQALRHLLELFLGGEAPDEVESDEYA
jgi:hypothetical protein